jgi:predicted RNA-binding Zn-ribbon protein involved in translation (DUF1610 family)
MIDAVENSTETATVFITASEMDSSGAQYLLIGFGESEEVGQRVDRWIGTLAAADKPVAVHRVPSTGAGALVTELLAASATGMRLMLCGQEIPVLEAISAARIAGLLPCEIFAHVTASPACNVFCAHCATTSRHHVEPGASVGCPGCGREIIVRTHMSTLHAAYLAAVE